MGIIRMRTRFVPLLIVIASLTAGRDASAQSAERRLELGGQFSALRIQDFGSTPAGLGGRVSYDLSDWLSIESELNFFPRDTITLEQTTLGGGDLRVAYRRRRSEAVFGPKVGVRYERFGVFAKVRPGFARLTDRGVGCEGEVCALMLFAQPVYRTEFALDLGAVLEFYPSPRTIARIDLGDTMIRHRSQAAPMCSGCTSHNFASRIGVGVRF
jgi:hypothetical protein